LIRTSPKVSLRLPECAAACKRRRTSEQLGNQASKPTVKQHLAAIRQLFDYLTTGGILEHNPVASVRGPKYDAGPANKWSLEQWAEDVHSFCEALSIEDPIVMGHSLGGIVAMVYAMRYPDHPYKLILSSTSTQPTVGERSLPYSIGWVVHAPAPPRWLSGLTRMRPH
jgi:pimeloyl-ACP methyl ester carboxylesterase